MAWLNRFAENWWAFFAVHMLETALFLLLLMAVERVLNLHLTTRYALWLLGLAKMFVPPFLALPASLEERASTIVLPNIIVLSKTVAQPAETLSPHAFLLMLWALSAILLLSVMLYRHFRLQRRLRNATPLAAFADVPCPAFETTQISSPVLLGLFQPKLFLPQDWRAWPPQHLQSILQHEAAHMRNRDLHTLVLESLALVLFGLNPLVWLMRRRLTYLRELRCDFAAMARTGMSALDYGKLLYAFAEKQSQPTAALATGIPFAAQQSTLYQRLQHLLTRKETDMNANKLGRLVLLGVMSVLLLVFSWQCSGSKLMDKAPLAPETQTAANQAAPAPDSAPKVVDFSAPQYPAAAKAAGVQGMVFVQMELNAEGQVAEAKVLKSRKMTDSGTEDVASLGYGLEEAALAAARATKFMPATSAGTPKAVTITMPFSFKLDDSTEAQLPKKESAAKLQDAQPFDQAPEMLSAFNLKYPEAAHDAKITGTTFLEIGISAKGETETVVVKQSSGNESLDQAALAAAREMKWKPAYSAGKPIAVTVVLPARFKLSE